MKRSSSSPRSRDCARRSASRCCHYSPIRATVEGEPPEIFAYLGSSRLEEPINRFRVSAVFHGHAHRGAPEGRTSTGVPVHNVSMPLLMRTNPNRPPFLIVEMPLDDAEAGSAAGRAARRTTRQIGLNSAQPDAGTHHVIDTDVPLLTSPDTAQLYRDALEMLNRGGVPYSSAARTRFSTTRASAARRKTSTSSCGRATSRRVLDVLTRCGFKTEIAFHHWLAKAHHGENFIDVIFNSGNGIAEVDDEWFAHAVDEIGARRAGEARARRRDDLDEGNDHGARAL